MKISTKGRYALRAMLDLALHNTGECIKVKDIAQRQDISEKYLEQIIAILNKAGFVKSVRGAQGGYKLARAPKDYTIGDILRVTEGTLNPAPEGGDFGGENDIFNQCENELIWDRLYKAINDVVDGITLEDIVRDYSERLNGFDFVI